MTQCEVCGNRYDKSFDVIGQGVTHAFDNFATRTLIATKKARPAPRSDGCHAEPARQHRRGVRRALRVLPAAAHPRFSHTPAGHRSSACAMGSCQCC